MKWVIINAYQIGLVFKNGAYLRMVKAGNYFLWASETGSKFYYLVTRPFVPAYELNIFLQDKELAEALHLVEVKDHEIALLQYENGLLKQVLTPDDMPIEVLVIAYAFVYVDLEQDRYYRGYRPAKRRQQASVLALRAYLKRVENHEKRCFLVDGYIAGR